jgi:hypothetical protein
MTHTLSVSWAEVPAAGLTDTWAVWGVEAAAAWLPSDGMHGFPGLRTVSVTCRGFPIQTPRCCYCLHRAHSGAALACSNHY